MPTSNVQLLCEGFDELYIPEVIYVKQGNKVAFTKGRPDMLHESLGEVEIVEDVAKLEMTVVEKNGAVQRMVKDGTWIAEGPFQRSDVKNANKRVYPRSIWEKQLGSKSANQKRIKEGGMYGHLEHPSNGKSDLNEAAVLMESAELKEDGTVWGRTKLLNTTKGLNLQAFSAAGGRWGISSRGTGSVGADGVVGEDYNLVTFDAVTTPSTPGAFPTVNRVSDAQAEAPRTESVTESDQDKAVDGAVIDCTPIPDDELPSDPVDAIETMLARSKKVVSLVEAKRLRPMSAMDSLARLIEASADILNSIYRQRLDENVSAARKDKVVHKMIGKLRKQVRRFESTHSEMLGEVERINRTLQRRIAEATSARKAAFAVVGLADNKAAECAQLEAQVNALSEVLAERLVTLPSPDPAPSESVDESTDHDSPTIFESSLRSQAGLRSPDNSQSHDDPSVLTEDSDGMLAVTRGALAHLSQ